MLHMHLFSLDLTVSVKLSGSRVSRYEDRKRVRALRERMLDKQMRYTHYLN